MTGWRWAVAAELVAAALLRAWGIADPAPGFYRDEAIEGLHGVYHWRGLIPVDAIWIRFSRIPVWELCATGSVALLGPTVLAARLPAVVGGTAAAALAAFGWRAGLGPWPALAAAGMLGSSLWAVVYGRIGSGPCLVPLHGVALVALLLRPVSRTAGREGFLAGLVAGSAVYSYYAGVHLPMVLAFGLLVRVGGDGAFRAVAPRWALGALAGVGVSLVPLAGRLRLFHDIAGYPGTVDWAEALRQEARYLGALFLSPHRMDPRVGIWAVWPPGGALLRPVEAAVAAGGLAAALAGPPPRWRWWLAPGWLLLALLPASVTPGGLRWSRTIGVLVPAALLAAGAAAMVLSVVPRRGAVLVAAACAAIAAVTRHEALEVWRRSPQVALWADRVDTDTALYLKARAAVRPLQVSNPVEYSTNPVWTYLLDAELRTGRIRSVPAGPRPRPRLVHIIRDPLAGQPSVVVFDLRGEPAPGRDSLGLADAGSLMEPGSAALARGDAVAAERYARGVLALIPDFGLAHLRLADALAAQGRLGEARRERERAAALGIRTEDLPALESGRAVSGASASGPP